MPVPDGPPAAEAGAATTSAARKARARVRVTGASVVPAPALPINYIRLCIWTRWCSGAGRFRQKSRIVGVDEQQVIAQAEVEFVLKEMEGHATNVHYFGGVQFQQYGLHHIEIYLENELQLRFPLPVIKVARPTG